MEVVLIKKPLPRRYVDITKQGLNDFLPWNKTSLLGIRNRTISKYHL
jgi:hypothetical protein